MDWSLPNPVLEAAEILWPITSRGFNEELGFVFFFYLDADYIQQSRIILFLY